jgi:hypothetical protein
MCEGGKTSQPRGNMQSGIVVSLSRNDTAELLVCDIPKYWPKYCLKAVVGSHEIVCVRWYNMFHVSEKL